MKISVPLSTAICLLICSTSYSATGGDGKNGPESNSTNEIVRIDLLQADMKTPITNTKQLAFERYVQLGSNGLYAIKVVSVGMMQVLRIEGTYADSELTIPHGQFFYYHNNGRLESKGEYRNGLKYGIWERASISGEKLAEKVYAGLSLEQTLLDADQISKAATLTAPRVMYDLVEF